MVGEYVGTTLFLLLALGGTNVANIPDNSVTGETTAGQDGSAAASVNVSSDVYPPTFIGLWGEEADVAWWLAGDRHRRCSTLRFVLGFRWLSTLGSFSGEPSAPLVIAR